MSEELSQHPDDIAVDAFAATMKSKMKKARGFPKFNCGWENPDICSAEYLADLLVNHLTKGNPGTFEDVANFAMMLHQRGENPAVLATAITAWNTRTDTAQAENERLRKVMHDMAVIMSSVTVDQKKVAGILFEALKVTT